MRKAEYVPGRTVTRDQWDNRRALVTSGVYRGLRGTVVRADGPRTAMVKLDGAMSGTSIAWADLRELTPVEDS